MIGKDEHPNFTGDTGANPASDNGVGLAMAPAGFGDDGGFVCRQCDLGTSGGGSARGEELTGRRVCFAGSRNRCG